MYWHKQIMCFWHTSSRGCRLTVTSELLLKQTFKGIVPDYMIAAATSVRISVEETMISAALMSFILEMY